MSTSLTAGQKMVTVLPADRSIEVTTGASGKASVTWELAPHALNGSRLGASASKVFHSRVPDLLMTVTCDAGDLTVGDAVFVTPLDSDGDNVFTGANTFADAVTFLDCIVGTEIEEPEAPAANGFVLFAQDNGAGKTQLMVRFQSGASQQIAIEPA